MIKAKTLFSALVAIIFTYSYGTSYADSTQDRAACGCVIDEGLEQAVANIQSATDIFYIKDVSTSMSAPRNTTKNLHQRERQSNSSRYLAANILEKRLNRKHRINTFNFGKSGKTSDSIYSNMDYMACKIRERLHQRADASKDICSETPQKQHTIIKTTPNTTCSVNIIYSDLLHCEEPTSPVQGECKGADEQSERLKYGFNSAWTASKTGQAKTIIVLAAEPDEAKPLSTDPRAMPCEKLERGGEASVCVVQLPVKRDVVAGCEQQGDDDKCREGAAQRAETLVDEALPKIERAIANMCGQKSTKQARQSLSDPSAEVVMVGRGETPSCTGLALTKNAVITARHCLPSDAIWLTGEQDDQRKRMAVKEAVPHPDPQVDAALLFVSGEITEGGTSWRKKREAAPIGSVCHVGYGASSDAPGERFGRKHYTEIPISSWGCDLRNASTLSCMPDKEMALYSSGGRDTCYGDSGGPLFEAFYEQDSSGQLACKWRAVGLTSRAIARTPRACGFGGIYVRFDHIAPWIELELKKRGDEPR